MLVSTRRAVRVVNLADAASADHCDDLIRPEAASRSRRGRNSALAAEMNTRGLGVLMMPLAQTIQV